MMKFTILFCVLLAGGSLATKIPKYVVKEQNKVINKIEKIIDDAKEGIKGTAEAVAEFRPRLEKGIADYEKEFDEKLKNYLNKVDETLNKVDTSNTKCKKLALELSDSALTAVSNASYCIVSKPLFGKKYTDSIDHISASLVLELEAAREEAIQCTKIEGNTPAEQIICINKASIKANWLNDKKLLDLVKDSFAYAYLLAVIDIDIPFCIDDESFTKLTASTEEIRVNLEKCVAQD